jgi:acyl-CoA thioesterase-1
MKKLWLVAMAAAMCGCRDKRAGATAPEGARHVIACFGDSLTAGFGLAPGRSYPDVLQAELERAGYRYRVLNFGVSGETTRDGLSRLRAVADAKPAIVVLEFGANDGLRGVPVVSARANLARMIEALQGAGTQVVLAGMTLPPEFGSQDAGGLEAMYFDLAARYNLPLIPFILEGVAGHPALMQPDGLHPNAGGARQVAATVMRALEPLIEKTR